MPPYPPNPTAQAPRPRHAAGVDPRTPRGGAADPSYARHRRPETLADGTRLRPTPAVPPTRRRSADEPSDRGFPDRRRPDLSFADRRLSDLGLSELGLSGPRPADRRFFDPGSPDRRPFDRRLSDLGLSAPIRRTEPPRADRRRAGTGPGTWPARRRHADASRWPSGRGKHAAPPDLASTVPSLPAVRDAVAEGLPAARRAAEAVRKWAIYTGDAPPAVGSHRAPGTLPIESWLLVGRGRQQALLATLVAVGLALVMIPVQRHHDINAVSAANRAAAGPAARHKAHTNPPAAKPPASTAGGTSRKPTGRSPAPAGSATPTALPGTPPASAPAPDPVVVVPPGTGPAQSLRVTGSDTVALTFDDGPDPVQTPKILALLDEYQVKATFCLVGRQVRKHPEIVRQIVAAGHTLCNHTWNHSLTIGEQTPAQIRADLDRTSAAIHAAAPGAPIPFFRAPGGNFTDRLVGTAYRAGMASLYWEVDPRDWDHTGDADDEAHTARVVADVEKLAKPGAIILSHDFNQPDTVAAYEKLLPYLTGNFEIGVPVPPPVPDESPAPPSGEPPSSAAAPPDPQ